MSGPITGRSPAGAVSQLPSAMLPEPAARTHQGTTAVPARLTGHRASDTDDSVRISKTTGHVRGREWVFRWPLRASGPRF